LALRNDESPLSTEIIKKMAKPLGTTPTRLMRECLVALCASFATSPFGKALDRLVEEGF